MNRALESQIFLSYIRKGSNRGKRRVLQTLSISGLTIRYRLQNPGQYVRPPGNYRSLRAPQRSTKGLKSQSRWRGRLRKKANMYQRIRKSKQNFR